MIGQDTVFHDEALLGLDFLVELEVEHDTIKFLDDGTLRISLTIYVRLDGEFDECKKIVGGFVYAHQIEHQFALLLGSELFCLNYGVFGTFQTMTLFWMLLAMGMDFMSWNLTKSFRWSYKLLDWGYLDIHIKEG